MRILITGAGGFAGAHVARHLATLPGFYVTACVRRETPELPSLRALGVHVIHCDVMDASTLSGPVDAIVHCAAAGPWAAPDQIAEDNVAALLALADAAAERWRPRRVIFFSSICVYGDIAPFPPLLDEKRTRIDPCVYGQSKFLGEQIWFNTGISTLALRLPGIIGLRAAPRNWLPALAAKLHGNHRPVPVPIKAYNLDAPFNNAVHIVDVCQLIEKVLRSDEANVGDVDGCSDAITLAAAGQIKVRDAIALLAEDLGQLVEIEEISPAKAPYLISSARAQERWGYAPMEISEMIRRYAREVVAYVC